MKLVIGHLYNDLMNLYGENGNIKVLMYHLKSLKIDVELKELSLENKINFDNLDLIYMGCGTEDNRKIVLNNLMKYKNNIKKAYKNNKMFLITGNALALFGEYIEDINNEKIECLSIFNFHTKIENKRFVKEVSTKAKFVNDDILGFLNTSDKLYNDKGKEIEGYGIYKKNFYGTNLVGPILARNPEFLNYFVTKLIKYKDGKEKVKELNTKFDEEAYLDYVAIKEK